MTNTIDQYRSSIGTFYSTVQQIIYKKMSMSKKKKKFKTVISFKEKDMKTAYQSQEKIKVLCNYYASVWILFIYLKESVKLLENNNNYQNKIHSLLIRKTRQIHVKKQICKLKTIIMNIICIAYMCIILCQSNDIEKNPGPATGLIDYIVTKIIGNTHQGSDKYLQMSSLCASSCMANSLMSMTYKFLKQHSTWTSTDIDNILYLGITLYELLYPNRITRDECPYLQVNDLNVNFSIDNRYFKSECGPSYCGNLLQQSVVTVNSLPTIEQAFENAFVHSNKCILILMDYGMSIEKHNNKYYVFDPHSRNEKGLFTENGHAIYMEINDFDIFNFIRTMSMSSIPLQFENVLFEITPIKIIEIPTAPEIFYQLHTKEIQNREIKKTVILQFSNDTGKLENENNIDKGHNICTVTKSYFTKTKNIEKLKESEITISLEKFSNQKNDRTVNHFNMKNTVPIEETDNALFKEQNTEHIKETKINNFNDNFNIIDKKKQNNDFTKTDKKMSQKQIYEEKDKNIHKETINLNQKGNQKKEKGELEITGKCRYNLRNKSICKGILNVNNCENKETQKRSLKSTELKITEKNIDNCSKSKKLPEHTIKIDKEKSKEILQKDQCSMTTKQCMKRKHNEILTEKVKEKNQKKLFDINLEQNTDVRQFHRKRKEKKEKTSLRQKRLYLKRKQDNVQKTFKTLSFKDNTMTENLNIDIQSNMDEQVTNNVIDNIVKVNNKRYEHMLKIFFDKISMGPTYICNCCERFLYFNSMVKYNEAKYQNFEKNILQTYISGIISHNCQWLCCTCERYLKKGKIPQQASRNNLRTCPIPKQLSILCPLEKQLISLIIPFMKIVHLPVGNQHGLRGQVVLVPSNLQKVTDTLPRNTSESQIIALSFKRRLNDKHCVTKQYVRPQYINEAIALLIHINPNYNDIHINKNWNVNIKESDIDFWNKMTYETKTMTNKKKRKTKTPSENNLFKSKIKNLKRKITDNLDSTTENETVNNLSYEIDSEEELNNQLPSGIRLENDLKNSINSVTCIYPKEGPIVRNNQELQIAPGEGQIPTSIYHNKHWEALAFPTLFPNGENTFDTERPVKLTVNKYINTRLLSSDTRFAESPEYTFQCLHWSETVLVNNTITIHLKKANQEDLNAGKLKNKDNVHELHKQEQLFSSYRKLRGTPQYWNDMRLDMIAKIKYFGPYTFFISGSAADFKWPELIMIIAKQYGENLTIQEIEDMTPQKRRNYLARNPVTVARHIDYIFEQLWKCVILSGEHPIGQILNYDMRKEMQARGTEHFHSAVHVKDAPRIGKDTDTDVIKFIDKNISCQIPDILIDKTLNELVISRQTHHHTKTCTKKVNLPCRFHFKRPPSQETIIAHAQLLETEQINKTKAILRSVMEIVETGDENMTLQQILEKTNVTSEQYHNALKMTTKNTIIYKRTVNDTSINPYNSYILKALRSNMDIQFVIDVWACIAYITSYMCKPEKEMSQLMTHAVKEADTVRDKLKAIGNTFLHSREISQHEAIARLISIPLRQSNITVKYIPTAPEENRTRMLKSKSELEKLDDNDKNVFVPNMVDRYCARPNTLISMCMAEFVSYYRTCSSMKTDKLTVIADERNIQEQFRSNSTIKLKNNLGYMQRKIKPYILRYYNVSKQNSPELYYHRLLLMYYPWTNEKDLKIEGSYEKKYDMVKSIIIMEQQKYEPCLEIVEKSCETVQDIEMNNSEMWDPVLAPHVEQSRNEQVNESHKYNILDLDNLDKSQQMTETMPLTNKGYIRTSTIKENNILTDRSYYKMIRSLNTEQRNIHDYIFNWCIEQKQAERCKMKCPKPFHIFLSGGGGVGKSHTIHAIYQTVIRQLKREGHTQDTPTIILTASTGKAAVNISGTTLHSAFKLQCRKRGEKYEYTRPAPIILGKLKNQYMALKIIVIDEISMIGGETFLQLNQRLQDIFENNDPFGNVSILAVGDLLQLNPVGDRAIFQTSKANDITSLSNNLWKELFYLHELETIVRQENDQPFAQLLKRLRLGQQTKEDINILKKQENNNNLPKDSVCLFSTNNEANVYNLLQLQSIGTQIYRIQANDISNEQETGKRKIIVTSTNVHETGGLRKEIEIAIGARYLHTKNTDLNDGLVNGATGIITNIDLSDSNPLSGTIYVQFDSKECGTEAKKNSKYKNTVPIKAVTETFSLPGKAKNINVERTQFPGTLAWGITVHKAQGSTYENMIGDMTSKCPSKPGQTYTMISRVKTINGLKLIGFDQSKIKVNKNAVAEMTRLQNSMKLITNQFYINYESESFIICQINVRSLKSHHKDIVKDSFTLNSQILCLTETNVIDYKMYKIGHMPYIINSCGNHGCAIYSTVKPTKEFQVSGIFEAVSAIITNKVIVSLYISPNTAWHVLEMPLTSLMTEINSISVKNNCQEIIITGDFNFNINNPNNNLFSLFEKFHLKQIVKGPTHIMGNTLDLHFTTGSKTEQIIKPVYFTDHFYILTKY